MKMTAKKWQAMTAKERKRAVRYANACRLQNIAESAPINREPRNVSRGFRILGYLEDMGWKGLTPRELQRFHAHLYQMNEGRRAYGKQLLTMPQHGQAFHVMLVRFRWKLVETGDLMLGLDDNWHTDGGQDD